MTPDQPAAPPTPGVRVEFTWAATGGSAPESASVWWEHVVPPPEEICQVITALAQSADRYELTADPEPGEPILSPLDICARETCRDARQVHPRNGACTLCAESIPCPHFLETAPIRADDPPLCTCGKVGSFDTDLPHRHHLPGGGDE